MNTNIEKFDRLNIEVSNMAEDIEKFFASGNKAAGTRARKELQKLKNLAQELRIDIQNTKNQ